MKVLFILPKIGSKAKWSVGLSYMSAVLKEAGHQVDLIEIEDKEKIKSIDKAVKAKNSAIIGISANSHQYLYAVEIAKRIKQELTIPIFIGGIHTTLRPEEAIDQDCFDGVCLGEADYAFLELVNKIKNGQDYYDTDNFWFKKGQKIIKNKIRNLIQDLDKLPYPDFLIFQFYKDANNKEIVPRFIFSRGCPFNCTYCCNHALKKIYHNLGRYVRFRSTDKAIEEIGLAKKKYNFSHFKIDDDTFSLNKKWVIEFCHKYKRKFDMSFECNVRPSAIDKETLMAFKKAGCNLIKIGVEAGNEDLRKEILGRLITNDQIINLFDTAKSIELPTFSFNMVGIPKETKKSIKQTIELNARIKPNIMQVTAFYPYPGTWLGDKCHEKGLIAKDHLDSYMEESILKLPYLSEKDIKKAVKNFKFNVYLKYDLKKALYEKISSLKSYVVSNPFLVKLIRPVYKFIKGKKI